MGEDSKDHSLILPDTPGAIDSPQPEEVSRPVKESTITEIGCLCDKIINPTIEYKLDQLEMAQGVIFKNRAQAVLIQDLLEIDG